MGTHSSTAGTHRLPRRLRGLLCIHLHEVVLQELHTRAEVGLVELVGDVPADGTKFAALLCVFVCVCVCVTALSIEAVLN